MLKLTWNTAKLGNLKCGAESPTNTEAIVDFSPLLKNMSKHGHCAATMINIYIFNIALLLHVWHTENVVRAFVTFHFWNYLFLLDFYLRYYQPGAWAEACICHTLNSNSLSSWVCPPQTKKADHHHLPHPYPRYILGSVLISTKINFIH